MSQLQELSNTLRKDILFMVYTAQSGHIGGPFSMIDFMTTLYFGMTEDKKYFLNYDKENPNNPDNDYVIISKAHCSPAMYSILAKIGYIDTRELENFRKLHSLLQGHITTKIPTAHVSGGSLGQGLSFANGLALGLRIDKKDNKVWCIVGDGELQEGQIWEAIMTARHYELSNIRLVVDRNYVQIDGHVENIMRVEDVETKLKAFGWNTISIKEGNNIDAILEGLEKEHSYNENKPLAIILHTVKGKGVSFMENTHEWHGKPPNTEQYEAALKELEG